MKFVILLFVLVTLAGTAAAADMPAISLMIKGGSASAFEPFLDTFVDKRYAEKFDDIKPTGREPSVEVLFGKWRAGLLLGLEYHSTGGKIEQKINYDFPPELGLPSVQDRISQSHKVKELTVNAYLPMFTRQYFRIMFGLGAGVGVADYKEEYVFGAIPGFDEGETLSHSSRTAVPAGKISAINQLNFKNFLFVVEPQFRTNGFTVQVGGGYAWGSD